MENHQLVLVLDFGGQYNQLIARRVREHNVFCEVKPYKTSIEEIKAMTPERIKKSEDFLDKWGHLAIFLGRFFPFIRTFVPFIAGMGGMHWRNFVIFNVLGGITWSTVFTLLGYFFGGIPFVQEHFELLIVGIVAVSIIPTVVGLVKAKLGKKNA